MTVLDHIGDTPLVKLRYLPEDYGDVYVKLESFNPGGSIKTRVAAKMIENAERDHRLKPGDTIIEATGGNTGIGLAIVSNIKGYKLVTVVPDNYSEKRINTLKAYGAQVILSDHTQGNDSHIRLVQKLVEEHGNYVWVDQFHNPASVEAHYTGTAVEICDQIHPNAFAACVGSAGTFQGIGRFLRDNDPETLLYAVQPEGCDLENGMAVEHEIEGVSLGIIPPLLDYDLITGYLDVGLWEVKDTLKTLAKKEGLFLGMSSGANILGAIRVARMLGRGKIVCTVAPDGGSDYLDKLLGV